ncbi:hypothetical protein C7999DRAFT_11051 [Corynascus novoguineensis]|uniref:Uncharacterized protein n=1 Tax=Corynascus novoguineensis TaxID=1126955 RepID=A0AAN7D250_9PEZI|nr:hypothetical protein C7999DRAFT_11051 [Corynascus novoguineensis]
MAQNNSSASVTGAVRPAGARLKRRPALSPSSAFQLFLEHRRRALRNSTSPEIDSKIICTDKSLTPSYSQPASDCRPLSSSQRKSKLGDLTQSPALLRHLGKLAPLYRRHRNLERALSLFLLRRQLWRRTRRPFFKMDLKRLRDIQADESSSDDEPGLVLASASVSAPRRRSPAPNPAAVAAFEGQQAGTEPIGGKQKRVAVAEIPGEDADPETSQTAKKAVVVPVSLALSSSNPAPVASSTGGIDGTKSPRKRTLEDGKAEAKTEERAIKKARTLEPAATKREEESSKSAQARSSKDAAVAALRPKPVAQMEYHDQRVHDMLTDPLGFDDFVYDTTRPMPLHAARSFAKFRRRQSHSAPPLIMSGALGPVTPGGKKPVNSKSKGPVGSLAKEARKRAHQQKVKERVQGENGIATRFEPGFLGAQRKGNDVAGKRTAGPKGNGGKRKDERWLTAARPGGLNGGERHQPDPKKFKKLV